MARIEILAPVGSEEMLRAAVFSGADAVYLGFSGFNARTGAGNFDADSLQEAVRFCHARGVAVHVALNTTVYGTELPALEQAIRAVAASGADAVICQDLAVATLIGKIAPKLPRHGSTQMSVHTLQGALELKELGFTRVVLARELSLPEVEHITKHCGIETECFIHGALCMSVSGQCYMSAFLGGRSGNRGSCAGPCRLPFEANALPEGKPGRLHHLSLKDNSAIDKLDKLQAIGVASAKIEGRLRTPEYVAAAVSACLAGREGRAYDRDLLKNAFSRSGFTSGYLDGKIDGTMFGVRSEADAELTKKTLPMLRELYRRERSRVPVQMKLEIEEGGEKLTVTDADGNKLSGDLEIAHSDIHNYSYAFVGDHSNDRFQIALDEGKLNYMCVLNDDNRLSVRDMRNRMALVKEIDLQGSLSDLLMGAHSVLVKNKMMRWRIALTGDEVEGADAVELTGVALARFAFEQFSAEENVDEDMLAQRLMHMEQHLGFQWYWLSDADWSHENLDGLIDMDGLDADPEKMMRQALLFNRYEAFMQRLAAFSYISQKPIQGDQLQARNNKRKIARCVRHIQAHRAGEANIWELDDEARREIIHFHNTFHREFAAALEA
jgi:collagenase-like PrtC family protease